MSFDDGRRFNAIDPVGVSLTVLVYMRVWVGVCVHAGACLLLFIIVRENVLAPCRDTHPGNHWHIAKLYV